LIVTYPKYPKKEYNAFVEAWHSVIVELAKFNPSEYGKAVEYYGRDDIRKDELFDLDAFYQKVERAKRCKRVFIKAGGVFGGSSEGSKVYEKQTRAEVVSAKQLLTLYEEYADASALVDYAGLTYESAKERLFSYYRRGLLTRKKIGKTFHYKTDPEARAKLSHQKAETKKLVLTELTNEQDWVLLIDLIERTGRTRSSVFSVCKRLVKGGVIEAKLTKGQEASGRQRKLKSYRLKS